MGELIDEGRRKALSERSAGSTSVVAGQVESMEEVEQQLIAQIAERREQHQLYLLFHSHADEVSISPLGKRFLRRVTPYSMRISPSIVIMREMPPA